jgi:Ca2+-binding RTX toxin-like protein
MMMTMVGESDYLLGGESNDEISGGGGDDQIQGGFGGDTFDCGSGQDKIHDYSEGEGDIKSKDCEDF